MKRTGEAPTRKKTNDPSINDILLHESGDGSDDKPAMWHVIEQCTEKGQEALDLLRDGKLSLDNGDDEGSRKKEKEKEKEREKKSGHTSASMERNEDTKKKKEKKDNKSPSNGNVRKGKGNSRTDAMSEEESDGGFFEK